MAKTKCTKDNVVMVLKNLTEFMEKECDESKEIFASDLDDFLDSLVHEDYFGTEAQCDPRGDQRD